MSEDYERGVREATLWCADFLRRLATVAKDDYADTFNGIAESWEKNPLQAAQHDS